MSKIKKIHGRQIFDSRGNPTIEVDITLEDGSFGRASVPSGASTGAYEAYELRDGAKALSGKTVLKAVNGINTEINDLLCGMEACEQEAIDNRMIDLDSTKNKSRLGANAILGVSLALSRAQANSEGKPLYEYLNSSDSYILPVPMMNLINGGAHSNNSLFIQEFMIMPISSETFNQAIITGSEIFHSLKNLLENDGFSTNVGDEGGVAPDLKTSEEALSYLCKAIEKAGYKLEEDIVFALDIAASELYKDGQYFLSNDNASSSEDLIDMWEELTNKYPIFSIEDPLHEDDWSGWINLNERIGKKTQIVGDDLFVTNPERLKMGIDKNAANSILIKVNQIGTITETLETINIAKNNKYSCVISHRSGETEDTFIADLSVATNSGQIKTGSMTRSDRVAKYNQLIRIESNLQNNSSYAGKSILKKN
ncbi:MAG: phosphopyruvate hydratase [Rhodobiaceae bacterium]|nr:phosphopyruvate hydratase [Rhodobiaceae bacterium]